MELEVKVLAASEDAGCLNLLALVLQNQKNITLIGEAANWRELSSLVATLKPDVVLLDTDAPGNGAVAVIRTSKLKRIPTAFVGLVGEMDVDSTLLNLLDALILKSDPLREMTSTILAVTSKGKFLSRGSETGFKPFAETRRQLPMPEGPKDLPSSPIQHQSTENPQKAQAAPPTLSRPSISVGPDVKRQGPAISSKEAGSPRPIQRTVPTPAWDKGASNGSANGSHANSPFGSEKSGQPEPAAPSETAQRREEPSVPGDQDAKPLPSAGGSGIERIDPPSAPASPSAPSQTSAGGSGIERIDPEPSQPLPREGDDSGLAARLEAMRAALGSSYGIPTTAPTAPAPPAASRPEVVVATIAEDVVINEKTDQVAPEPAREPTVTVQPADDGVESTLREVLPSAGSIVLIASPFGNFRSLGSFQQALERLDGIRSMRVRRFQGGTLYAAIRYAGTVEQLETQIKELVQFDPRVVEAKPGVIELRINAGNDQPSND